MSCRQVRAMAFKPQSADTTGKKFCRPAGSADQRPVTSGWRCSGASALPRRSRGGQTQATREVNQPATRATGVYRALACVLKHPWLHTGALHFALPRSSARYFGCIRHKHVTARQANAVWGRCPTATHGENSFLELLGGSSTKFPPPSNLTGAGASPRGHSRLAACPGDRVLRSRICIRSRISGSSHFALLSLAVRVGSELRNSRVCAQPEAGPASSPEPPRTASGALYRGICRNNAMQNSGHSRTKSEKYDWRRMLPTE
jgi:hypothetical protein